MLNKEKIIEEAISQFAKKGFADTSFQLIANRLKVTQSAVMHYYKSKDDLIEGVVRNIVVHNHSIVSNSMRMEDNAHERLRKHFVGNLEWAVKFRNEAQIIVLLYYFSCFNKRFTKMYEEMLAKAQERIEEHLHSGKREGVFKFKESPKELSQSLHDLLVGGVVNTIATNADESSVNELKRRWSFVFDTLLK